MSLRFMYLGASARAGKTVFTRAHCRVLSDAGLRPAPFKPVCVTDRQEERKGVRVDFRIWLMGAAARADVGEDNCPVQVIRTGPGAGDLRFASRRWGAVPLLAEDSPLLSVEQVGAAAREIELAFERVSSTADALLIEGAGSCVDLPESLDLANVHSVRIARPAVVLLAAVGSGGALAALAGSWDRMAPDIRERTVGFALNDARGGMVHLDRAAARLSAAAGVAYLGALPHCPIYDDVPAGEHSALRDDEREADYLAEFLRSHIDVDFVHRTARGMSTRDARLQRGIKEVPWH